MAVIKHAFRMLCRVRVDLLLAVPLLMYLFVFTFLPICQVFIISLSDPQTSQLTVRNFVTLLLQPGFRLAFVNTVIIALGSLLLEVGLGLLLAIVLSHQIKVARWLRSLFMVPLAIPTVVAAVMMSYIFSSSGWLNQILQDIGLIENPIIWLQGGFTSMLAVMVADSWKVTPLVMLILLAGLQSIDPNLYRAARIDGAGGAYIFRRITLPLLMPSITAAVIIRGIDAFRIFSLVLVLMGENLKVIGTYAYLEYAEYNNPHLSAAAAVILFLLIMAAVFGYIRLAGRRGLQAT